MRKGAGSFAGTFPLTLNWTIEYASYGSSEHPATLKRNFTCRRRDVVDLSSHRCLVSFSHNFSFPGPYRLTVFGANRLSHVRSVRYLWVYSTKHSTPFVTTIIFPLVFVVIALGLLVFGYVHYGYMRAWGKRSLEVADFEVSFSYNSEGGGGRSSSRSWRSRLADLWERYADWVRSLAEAPNVPTKPHIDAATLARYYPDRRRVGMMELIKALPFHEPPPPLSPEQQRQRQTMMIAEDNRGGDDNTSRKSF